MTDRAGRPPPRRSDGLARALAMTALALAASGCADAPVPAQPLGAGTVAEANPPTEHSPRSPEASGSELQPAPELFSEEEWALWDGQRTLGGRWVALPDIDTARRVRLTDAETGTAVDGALIRRDPDQAGPKLIISSEAAQSLGLRPGVAAPVMIVALAYQADRAQDGQRGDTDAAPLPERHAATDDSRVAESEGPDTALERPAPPEAAAANAPLTAAAAAQAVAPADLTEASARAAPAPAMAQPAVAPGEPGAAAPEIATAQPAVAPGQPAAAMPEAATALPRDEAPAVQPPDAALASPTEVDAAAARAEDAPLAEDAPAEIADGLPFIQAGVFADPANAARLVARLRAAGLPAGERLMTPRQGGLTRVVIGPYRSVDERDRALETVKKIGPSDAIPVRG